MGLHRRTRMRWLLAALATGTLVACAASDPAGESTGDAKGDRLVLLSAPQRLVFIHS